MLHACSPAAQLAIVPASLEEEEGKVHASSKGWKNIPSAEQSCLSGPAPIPAATTTVMATRRGARNRDGYIPMMIFLLPVSCWW